MPTRSTSPIDRDAPINRLWGIPLIGQLVRWVLLIPHFIVLLLLVIVAALQLLVTWIPVLLLGRFPGWGYRWIGGLLGYAHPRAVLRHADDATYPPFSLSGEDHPVSVRYDEGVRINRLWGIPVVGILVRGILLIPHFIVLWAWASWPACSPWSSGCRCSSWADRRTSSTPWSVASSAGSCAP